MTGVQTCALPISALHAQASYFLHSGAGMQGRPSLGAWALYGLGTVNQDLPGFIALSPSLYHGGAQNYGAAFLPAAFQGTRLGDGSTPFRAASLANAAPADAPRLQRLQLDLLAEQTVPTWRGWETISASRHEWKASKWLFACK